MKVFSRAKCIKQMGMEKYESHQGWVDRCDGKPVKDGKCGEYFVCDAWCCDEREWARLHREKETEEEKA